MKKIFIGSALGLVLGALLFLARSRTEMTTSAEPSSAKTISWDSIYEELRTKEDTVVMPRLMELGRSLTPKDYEWLQATVDKGTTDKRFFALYALGLSKKTKAISILKNLALRDDRGKEWQTARVQAVKGIAQSCEEHSEVAREALLSLISSGSDEIMRDEAHRKLKDCLGK